MIRFFAYLLLIMNSGLAHASSIETYFKVEEVTTQKGFSYYAIKNNDLPLISVSLAFDKAGFAYDPSNKQGLAHLSARAIKDGAGPYDKTAFYKALESLATKLSVSIDETTLRVEMTCLSKQLVSSLELVQQVLSAPQLAPKDIALHQSQILSEQQKASESSYQVAFDKLKASVFKDHPYHRNELGTKEGVSAINQSDIKNYLARVIAKNNVTISVAGKADTATLNQALDRLLDALGTQVKSTAMTKIPRHTFTEQPSILHVEKNSPQSVVVFALPAPDRKQDSFYPFYIANYLIGGGGFESRLMQRLREDKGYVYTASTSLKLYPDQGVLVGYMATRPENVSDAISALRSILSSIKQNGLERDEIGRAKEYLTGSFLMRLNTTEKLNAFLNVMQVFSLGKDFLVKRNPRIEAASIKDINDSILSWIDLSQLHIVVVGQKEGS